MAVDLYNGVKNQGPEKIIAAIPAPIEMMLSGFLYFIKNFTTSTNSK